MEAEFWDDPLRLHSPWLSLVWTERTRAKEQKGSSRKLVPNVEESKWGPCSISPDDGSARPRSRDHLQEHLEVGLVPRFKDDGGRLAGREEEEVRSRKSVRSEVR